MRKGPKTDNSFGYWRTKESRREEYLKFRPRYLKNAMDRRARIAKERFGVDRPIETDCEICGDLVSGVRLHLDHNHKTGKFRGWLCTGCNTKLGFIENGELERALKYLKDKQ